jgi:hypothetical protein
LKFTVAGSSPLSLIPVSYSSSSITAQTPAFVVALINSTIEDATLEG